MVCSFVFTRTVKFEMADRRDWGGGGDDPEESTQRMIEWIWESLTDIRAMMDQRAPVPPVAVPPGDGETVPVALVPPGVEVPFVAPLPPPPPVLLAEEPWKKQPREQLHWRGLFELDRWASQAHVVFGYRSSQWVQVRVKYQQDLLHQALVKEEDGEVVRNFSRVAVGQRWRSRSKALPGNPLLHQDIDVIIAISRDI
ncbi:hypothetical protein Taro_027898 [Colocasia esculenta]|uniref:Uncharacterized protein n=1 Tax=Colocasia esculenta TaxID=4460 RepID=A0A843VJF3_COLES|nr:hypothetical protein [Colocasia esculenta]